jgi:hypothetical protein
MLGNVLYSGELIVTAPCLVILAFLFLKRHESYVISLIRESNGKSTDNGDFIS